MSEQTVYVAGFMFSEDLSQVALVRKNRPAWQAGKLNGVGGHVEAGETPALAMEREFNEETGVGWWSWTHFARLEGGGSGSGFVVEFFYAVALAETLSKLRASEGEEQIEIWSVAKIVHGSPEFIENIPWLVALALDSQADGRPSFTVAGYDYANLTAQADDKAEIARLKAEVQRLTQEREARFDCHGGPGTCIPACGTCHTCMLRDSDDLRQKLAAAVERAEAREKETAMALHWRDVAKGERDTARKQLAEVEKLGNALRAHYSDERETIEAIQLAVEATITAERIANTHEAYPEYEGAGDISDVVIWALAQWTQLRQHLADSEADRGRLEVAAQAVLNWDNAESEHDRDEVVDNLRKALTPTGKEFK